MARIISPEDYPEMRGRFGKLVYSRNQFGNYVKLYVKPRNPRTMEQTEVRDRMGRIGRLWRSLEFWQIMEWEEATRFFDIKNAKRTAYLTGFHFFVKTNLNLMKIGEEPIMQCPIEMEKPMIIESAELEILRRRGREDMILRYEPDMDEDNVIVVYASRSRVGYRKPREKDFKQIGVIDGRDNPVSIMRMYEEKFWERVEDGEVVFVRLQVVNKRSGMAGEQITVSSEQ